MLGLLTFRFEVKCRCFRCGDEKIAGCRGQLFFFRNELINGIFDNCLIRLCEIFVYFCIEFSVGQLSKSFFSVKVGAPNDHGTAFVGLTLDNVVQSIKILVGSPFFFRKILKFEAFVEIEFLDVYNVIIIIIAFI